VTGSLPKLTPPKYKKKLSAKSSSLLISFPFSFFFCTNTVPPCRSQLHLTHTFFTQTITTLSLTTVSTPPPPPPPFPSPLRALSGPSNAPPRRPSYRIPSRSRPRPKSASSTSPPVPPPCRRPYSDAPSPSSTSGENPA